MKSSGQNFLPIVVIYFVTIVFAVFGFMDLDVAGFSLAFPLFDVIAIYYFRVFRGFFPLWFVFLLGLITDSMAGEILGITSLIYIAVIKFFEYLETRLAIKDDFKQVLRRFLAFLACFLFLKWFLLSIINFTNYDFWMIIVQFLISSMCYVFMHKILENYYVSHCR